MPGVLSAVVAADVSDKQSIGAMLHSGRSARGDGEAVLVEIGGVLAGVLVGHDRHLIPLCCVAYV
jgi:hypothetical protein